MGKMDDKYGYTDGQLADKYRQTKAYQALLEADGYDVYSVTNKIVEEVFGQLGPTDFYGMSDITSWHAHQDNLIARIVKHDLKAKKQQD